MNDHYDNLETLTENDRKELLIKKLSAQISHARNYAPFYKAHFKELDLENLTSFDQLADLPLTRKSTLQQEQNDNPPFGGMLAVRNNDDNNLLGNVFASPGPIYEPSTKRQDYWRFARALHAVGFRQGDLVMNCFSYHLSPAGAMGETGCHALGCAVIPAGVGQTELQLQTIDDLKPNAYVGTPSFLKIILEKADEFNLDVTSINKALVAGEAYPPSLRKLFEENGINALQCYATADLGLIAYESSAESGLIADEGVYLEIVRPGTGDPVAAGEVGEIVVTTLNPDYPLIRFATGDLSAIMSGESSCGRTNQRIKGWMGRADQTAKVRGMFVRPELIDKVAKRHVEIMKARLVIDWVDESDQMTLYCESDQPSGDLKQAIENSIRDVCKVRGEVEFVDPESLQNDGVVIEDIRKYE